MRNLLVLTLTCFVAGAAAGCTAPPPPLAEGEGEAGSAFIIRRPPPVPYVAWQFRDCLTQNQRDGLILALLDYYNRTGWLEPLQRLEGDSRCLAGEERGGLFVPGWLGTDRLRALNILNIRPTARLYSFELTHAGFVAVASWKWDRNWYPRRFDEHGTLTDSGRYQFDGVDENSSQLPWTRMAVHATDTQRATAGIDLVAYYSLSLAGSYPAIQFGSYEGIVPGITPPDPFVQNEMFAATLLVHPTAGGNYFEQMFINPVKNTVRALALDECFSLQGWGLRFDILNVDTAGDIIVSGGDLIL